MSVLILVRHGQSQWNLENRFTGWVDVDLTDTGIEEAHNAGKLLNGFKFDIAFTSTLKRAVKSLHIILKEIGQDKILVKKNRALNERMYGDLQGLNKKDIENKYGINQTKLWRKSYDVPPPNGESLKDTAARVIPFWNSEIVPELKSGKTILVCAHGNSIRALRMHIEHLSKKQIAEIGVPTGIPKYYEFDVNLSVIQTYYIDRIK